MTVLIIILSILLLIFISSLFNIKLIFRYKDKPVLTVKVLFLKFVFKPKNKTKKKKGKSGGKNKGKKKKVKKKKVKKDSKKKVKTKKERKNPISEIMKKQGLSGLIELLKDLLSVAGGVLKGFFDHFIINSFDVKIVIGGDDASDIAIQYGAACAVVYPVMGQLYTRLNVQDYKADVSCDFQEGSKTQATACLFGKIRIIYILSIALKALLKVIKTYLKMRFIR